MQPRWIKLSTAISYSSIGRDELKRLVASGRIRGYQRGPRGDYILDRLSIDQYHLSHIDDSADDKAIAIIGSL